MQIVGFNLNKVSARKEANFKQGHINTNIEFTDLEKDKIDILKDLEVMRLTFKFGLDYTESQEKKDKKLGELIFEGNIKLALSKEESKEMNKEWKKKTLPAGPRIFLFNYILKKTAPKALLLQDELGLPSHIPIQQVTLKKDE